MNPLPHTSDNLIFNCNPWNIEQSIKGLLWITICQCPKNGYIDHHRVEIIGQWSENITTHTPTRKYFPKTKLISIWKYYKFMWIRKILHGACRIILKISTKPSGNNTHAHPNPRIPHCLGLLRKYYLSHANLENISLPILTRKT